MNADYVEAEDIEIEDVESGIENSEVEEIELADVEEIEDVEEIKDVHGSNVSIPSSPTLSDLATDRSLPPTSDAGEELVDVISDEVEEMGRQSMLKRKHSDGTGVEVKFRWKVARRGEKVGPLDDERGDETDGDEKQSRSTVFRKELNKLAKSGGLVVDERKRKGFEEKCIKMDSGAEFRYGAGWQVLHSKCLKWYRMSEPYNTAKFKHHIGMCKAKGEWRNLPITKYFKPMDAGEIDAEAKKSKIKAPSARKQIVIGSYTSTPPKIKPPHTDNKITAQSQPCCGISDTHTPLVSTYISRTVVEGAGSVSLKEATRRVFGDGVKYSDLTSEQKGHVAATQSHLRSWIINRELRAVFSTQCTKFVEQDQFPKTVCGNCETVARSDAFRRALRVKPTTVENMKYIPKKYRGPLEDLGAKFAGIRGLTELLKDVSPNPVNANFTVNNIN